MRKLATIATIEQIRPHPNADSLELATVRGWQVVTKKGEFQAGDLCVYCEIDSVMPDRPEFEFLRDRKFRIKTIRLRGELSQGICFPLSILPYDVWNPGDDVTEELGVTLHSPPIPACLGGDVEGAFPSFIPKTDCERVQNHPWILDELNGIEWAVTEKLDGASVTVYWKDNALHVCSRNWELRESENNAYWRAARALNLAEKLCDTGVALQGELLGPGIQGNRYGVTDVTIRFFDAYDFYDRSYLKADHQRRFCKERDLLTVPLLADHLHLPGDSGWLPEVLATAEGPSKLNPKVEREGVVWRPMVERTDPRIGRVAFKAISNRFLLKQKD